MLLNLLGFDCCRSGKFTSPIHMKLYWMIEQCIWNNPIELFRLLSDGFPYSHFHRRELLFQWIVVTGVTFLPTTCLA